MRMPPLTSFTILLFLFLASPLKSETVQNKNLEIVFQGNKIFPSQQLLNQTNNCLATDSKSQGAYNPEMLDYCLRTVRQFMSHQGFLRARFGETRKEETERWVRITVPVEEGALYRLGAINIEGSTLLSPGYLIEMLNLKTGDIARADAIGVWLFELVKKEYDDRGYMHYTAEAEPHFRPIDHGTGEGVVDFSIIIEEGPIFTVGSIKFAGNAILSNEVLMDTLMIRRDEPFSRERFNEGIKRMNNLGLFEQIDSDKDVDFVAVKGRELNLTIHVKEKTYR